MTACPTARLAKVPVAISAFLTATDEAEDQIERNLAPAIDSHPQRTRALGQINANDPKERQE
jgi:hypothetical protein